MKNSKLSMADICTSCANWKNCVLLTGNTSPIQQCEEFELSNDSSQPDISQIMVRETGKEENNKIDQEKILKGLCENCDMSKTCFLTDVPTGVWRCDEYQ